MWRRNAVIKLLDHRIESDSMLMQKGFASDNNSGVHPDVIRAIEAANSDHVVAYGDDVYTKRAIEKMRQAFGKDIDVHFVFGGTGANAVALKAMTDSYNAIICAETAHMNVEEVGAPEKLTGCKLLTIPSKNGKITVDGIKSHLHALGNQHHAQPKVVSITQSTEYGTVYTPDEIRDIADFAHEMGLLLHVDGARLANAAVSLGTGFKQITAGVGVDALSFGGTKNGMMYGEAVIFFDRELSKDFKYIQKQATQLPSKMRFISAQFDAVLSNGLWRSMAANANEMAKTLANELRSIPQIKITQNVEANAVFALIPKRYLAEIRKRYFFYTWHEDAKSAEVRLMASFDTTIEDIDAFVEFLKDVIEK